MTFDLLSTVEYGGCSAKLSPAQLADLLKDLPMGSDARLLVGTDTHDDAGVWKLTEEIALIQTTDFFPPVCSDPYDFGQIAAANALSDVYAMGGVPINALNLVMFPQNKIPLEVLRDILRGGIDKVLESGAVVAGGHTIDDSPPKYGLAVTGVVHPSRIITNAHARPGELIILTKPIGTGVLVAGHRVGEANIECYRNAIESMKLLNRGGSEVMQQCGSRCATDVTGFGLLGHALKMADASGVCLRIDAASVPLLDDTYRLLDMGCIPGGAFRNLDFVQEKCVFGPGLDYNLKMALLDPQTSGGLLFTVSENRADEAVRMLHGKGFVRAAVIGEVVDRKTELLQVN